jgi:hypothetical protein
MRKGILLAAFAVLTICSTHAQEYKIITTIESIIPGGLGRSRIIENKSEINSDDLTTDRTDGKKSDQGKVKRKNIKVDDFSETKLLNFYSMAGINFRNIASNDAVMSDRINEMVKEGWEMAFVTSGVESDAGEPDGQGIFVTRYIFKRN